MKKTQRMLLGCAATCLCFFLAMLTGSFAKPTAGIASSSNTSIQENDLASDSTFFVQENSTLKSNASMNMSAALTPESSISPTEAPTATPTATSTPTPTPTPTITPTPTPTSTPTPTPSPTPSPSPTPVPFIPNFTIPSVRTNLNIRTGPGTEHELIGKLPAESYAYILEVGDGWTKISTGTIKEAWVSSEYLFPMEDVISMCDRDKLVTAIISGTTLNIRSGPGTEYEPLGQEKKGKSFPAVLSKSLKDWIAIEYKDGAIGYISAAYVTFSVNLDTGLTLKEIKAMEEQKKLEAAMARTRVKSVKETWRDPITLTEEEIELMATVIFTEAGNQEYAGQLAVANVMVNRLLDGRWGDTITEVLYAKEQFAGTKPEYMKQAKKVGVPQSCFKAAREALSGHNNIGDFMFFCTKKKINYYKIDAFYELEDHIFYKRSW